MQYVQPVDILKYHDLSSSRLYQKLPFHSIIVIINPFANSYILYNITAVDFALIAKAKSTIKVTVLCTQIEQTMRKARFIIVFVPNVSILEEKM